MNDTEKATLAKTVAETVQIAVDIGVMDLSNAAREFSAISAESGIFTSMTADVIAQLDDEPPMPMVENVEAVEAESIQKITMNGAQVSSLVDIVAKVAQKVIPRESAVNMISTAFPVSISEAEKIVAQAGRDFVAAPEA